VSSKPASNYKIKAFAADSDGKLARVPGSPFLADVQFMALNGKFLFGTNGLDIQSFSIGPSGALQKVATINAQQFNGYNCGGPVALFLDNQGFVFRRPGLSRSSSSFAHIMCCVRETATEQ